VYTGNGTPVAQLMRGGANRRVELERNKWPHIALPQVNTFFAVAATAAAAMAVGVSGCRSSCPSESGARRATLPALVVVVVARLRLRLLPAVHGRDLGRRREAGAGARAAQPDIAVVGGMAAARVET